MSGKASHIFEGDQLQQQQQHQAQSDRKTESGFFTHNNPVFKRWVLVPLMSIDSEYCGSSKIPRLISIIICLCSALIYLYRMVYIIAMEVLPEERYRKQYAETYSCRPPPFFVIFITLLEVSAIYTYIFRYIRLRILNEWTNFCSYVHTMHMHNLFCTFLFAICCIPDAHRTVKHVTCIINNRKKRRKKNIYAVTDHVDCLSGAKE